jgi:arylsulfatase A-like enzyme/Flp pilus assembly protein TadD
VIPDRSMATGRGAALLVLVLSASCGGPPDLPDRGESPGALAGQDRRDVLLVTADTLRHDATGFSGSGRVATPLLDRLAQGGTVFTSARAHAVVTLPSHASILSGLYPYEHGIHDNAGFVLAEGIETMATLLRRDGYATAAFVSALPLDRRYGLDRGFDLYDDEYEGYGEAFLRLPERPGSETVARALQWWNANQGRKRFLWVHLFTPHFPYTPSEPFASRYRDQPYFGDVAMMDEELRPLLEPLLEAGEAAPIVIFTSDHGEALGEHGEQTHGIFAYDSTLKVPLVLWAPGMIKQGSHSAPVWLVDILPTTLDLLGLDTPDGLPGRSLFGDTRSGPAPEGYFEALAPYFNRGWAPLTGIMKEDRKAIRLPLPELYVLSVDPAETTNLAKDEPAAFERMLADLVPIEEILHEREEVDPETLARLRSLGYVSGNADANPEASFDPSRDPKNLIELDHLLDGALTAYHAGEITLAERTLRDLLRRQPGMLVAHAHLATLLVDLGRDEEAIQLLDEAQRRGVSDEGTRRILALAYLHSGRIEKARKTLEQDQSSSDPETLAALGRILAESGRPTEARQFFGRALEIDPTFPAARVDLAILKMNEGRFDEARPELEAALEKDRFHAEGWNALGVIHSQQGRPADAARAWERAVEIDPRLPDALYNLAAGRAQSGDLRGAIEAMERYSGLVDGEDREQALQILGELKRQAGVPPQTTGGRP